MPLASEGESYSVIFADPQVNVFTCEEEESLLKHPSTDRFVLTNLVLPEHVEALSGISR